MNGIFQQIAPDRIRMVVEEKAGRFWEAEIPHGGTTTYNVKEFTRERLLALEELWTAVQHWEASTTGYSPKIAAAVKRLRELERTGG